MKKWIQAKFSNSEKLGSLDKPAQCRRRHRSSSCHSMSQMKHFEFIITENFILVLVILMLVGNERLVLPGSNGRTAFFLPGILQSCDRRRYRKWIHHTHTHFSYTDRYRKTWVFWSWEMPNLIRNSLVIEEEERRHQCTQRHDRKSRCRCACCKDDHRAQAPRYTHAFALRKKRTIELTRC
jgi:hypothetical protein